MASAVEPRDGQSLRDRVAALRLPDKVNKSAGGTVWLPWALVILLAAATASLAARSWTAPAAAAKADAPAAARTDTSPATPAAASAPAPEARTGDLVLESKGYIIPARQVAVSPVEVSGLVLTSKIKEGRRFEKGDVMAVLDATRFKAEVEEARATLETARQKFKELDDNWQHENEQGSAELAEAEANLVQAKLEFERNSSLRGAAGALSPREYETARSTYQAAEQKVRKMRSMLESIKGPRRLRITAAEAEVKMCEARLERASWQFGNCTVKAPISGTVLKKNVEEGGYVNALAQNAAFGSGFCEMADLSDLEVDLEIQERDLSKVFEGQTCKVRAEAYPDRVYEGKVDRLMPTANRAKGSLPIRVKVTVPKDEEGKFLKPDMGAVVSFLK